MPYGQPFYTYPTAGYTAPAPNYNIYSPQSQMPSMAQNSSLNGFQQQGQGNAQQATQIPTKTNVPLVTSLTEAMSRTAELNTDTFYADQDKPFIYRVSVDMQGRKTYRTFELTDVTEQEVAQSAPTVAPEIDLSAYATKADLKGLEDKIMGYAQSFLGANPTPVAASKPKKTIKEDKVEKETVKTESEDIKE